MAHERYDEEIKRVDRTSQGGLWALGIAAALTIGGTFGLFLAPADNIYAIIGAATAIGWAAPMVALGVLLRSHGLGMTGGHVHYDALEQRLDAGLDELRRISRTLLTAADEVSSRRSISR